MGDVQAWLVFPLIGSLVCCLEGDGGGVAGWIGEGLHGCGDGGGGLAVYVVEQGGVGLLRGVRHGGFGCWHRLELARAEGLQREQRDKQGSGDSEPVQVCGTAIVRLCTTAIVGAGTWAQKS